MDRARNGPRPAQILLVDDQLANLQVLRDALALEGYEILVASSGEAALRVATARRPDLVLMDVLMPGLDGYETCRMLKKDESTGDIPVLFITSQEGTEATVEGFRAGGVDYITKPFRREEVLARVKTHLEINRLARELAQRNRTLSEMNARLEEANERLQAEMDGRRQAEAARAQADERFDLISENEAKRWGIEGFCGRSKTIARILEDVRQLQQAGTTSVLIQGESGTGKELVARAIHFGSGRAKKAFLVVNCSAIPAELAESAFFGHVRGAFTGASVTRRGYFELADGGTLFLDEIGDMSRDIQAKLLRVLEDGCVLPVGGAEEREVDVRVIAATHANLPQQVAQRRFRQDLFYRLARFVVEVPPLRERLEDVPLLIDHFCALFAEEMGVPPPEFSPAALQELMAYSFPGNVRELKNIVEFALIKSGGAQVGPEHLHIVHVPQAGVPARQETAPDPEEAAILTFVKQRGRISNADCRTLLSVDRRRATYLLDKLCAADLLVRVGANRGAHYRLPE